jgi:hypothetical protein
MHRTRWRDAREFHHSPHAFEWESDPYGGGEFEFEAPPAKSEASIVTDALQAGNYDENQITNAIFFQRHPDRAGTKIGANERQLANEWLNVRDQLVRPALRAIGITPIDVRPFRALLPLLEKYRGNIPLEFLLGWIAVESGGRIGVVTSLDERGYFQIHPDESAALGIDHKRLSTDPDYSIKKGIDLVKYHVARAARYGFAPGTELSWTVGKLQHWLPRGLAFIIALMRKNNFKPTTWTEFRKFTLDHRAELLAQLKAEPGKGWDPAVGIANVDKVLRRGHQIAQALGITNATNPEFESAW